MTPQEKAIELVNKYLRSFYDGLDWDQSKICALIAVDEILNMCSRFKENYWIEVKIEIEKL